MLACSTSLQCPPFLHAFGRSMMMSCLLHGSTNVALLSGCMASLPSPETHAETWCRVALQSTRFCYSKVFCELLLQEKQAAD